MPVSVSVCVTELVFCSVHRFVVVVVVALIVVCLLLCLFVCLFVCLF